MGIITAIGDNLAEHVDALKNKRSGIKKAKWLKTIHTFPVGEIDYPNEQLAAKAGVLKTLPRTALLSILAAQEAMAPLKGKLNGYNIGFISSNTVGGMDLTEQEYTQIATNEKVNPRNISYHECGSITELTVDALGLRGCWTNTISTACSSSANSIMLGAKLIEANQFDIIIAGGADCLSRFTLNGFNSLMILDKTHCQPFDENRRGLNLGEGAAYVVLMNNQTAKSLGATPLAVVSGYANTNDAHHQTASSPEGIGNQMAMRNALNQAGLQPEAIDYINLHGTGTSNNDSSEGIAIEHVFEGTNIPNASSTKCYTGHTLGAAGAVEAVFSILSIQEQSAWAHLRLATPMSSLKWRPIEEIVQQPIKHVLSNSFGFGGNCSALVLSKVD
jgi:3-oxoacyl-[acyl-carrier-protein] synthase-1